MPIHSRLFFSGLREGLVKSLRYFLPEECLKPSSVWTKDSHAKTRKRGSILTQRRKDHNDGKEGTKDAKTHRHKDANAERRKGSPVFFEHPSRLSEARLGLGWIRGAWTGRSLRRL